MQQSIEDSGGNDRIAKDVAPLAGGEVAGDENAAPLVAPADQLEHQMCSVRLKRKVSELIDDEELRFGEVQKSILESVLVLRFGKLCKQGRRGGEEHGVATLDDLSTQCNGEMSFAHTRWTEQQQCIAIGDPAT